jgi:predicted RNA binding protein YcfA (HicA-like mRNA interferase family)
MPREIRELIAKLQRIGFENQGGKGSHRNFQHLNGYRVTILGKIGDDAKKYQEKLVNDALREVKNR